MRIFLSSDMEGTAGVVDWEQCVGPGPAAAAGRKLQLAEDNAAIDGADAAQTFFRVILPLSGPAIASLAIFQFLWVWNDLLVALSYLGGRPSVAPLTVTIAGLVSSLGGGWHLLTAAAFVSMVLPLAVFFSLQRYFARGLIAGAVKD